MKDQNQQWLPIGSQFRRVLNDIKRVFPGPGATGLYLQHVGSTVPLDSSTELCPQDLESAKRICTTSSD